MVVKKSLFGVSEHVQGVTNGVKCRGGPRQGLKGGGGPASGRRRDLYAQQLVGEDVPEDGEEEEGDEGEDDDPPGALLLQTLLVAAQDQQAHADAHHGPRQVRHEAGLGPRGGQRWREAQPDGSAHLGTHCGDTRTRQRGGTNTLKIGNCRELHMENHAGKIPEAFYHTQLDGHKCDINIYYDVILTL